MTVLTDKPEDSRTDTTLLVEELAEIYTTPTPKGCRKAEKVTCIDWLDVFFTIAGVQYLYPEPKHESYLSMTHYNLCIKEIIPNLR